MLKRRAHNRKAIIYECSARSFNKTSSSSNHSLSQQFDTDQIFSNHILNHQDNFQNIYPISFIYKYIYTYICSLSFDMACILILMMSSSLRSTAVTVASTTTRNTSRPCTCLNGVIYTYRYEHGGCSRKIYFSTSTNYRYSRYKHINLRNDIEIKAHYIRRIM